MDVIKLNNEVWKPIKGYEGKYEVSNLGRVKSLNYNRTKKEKILKPTLSYNGYFIVILSKNGKTKKFRVNRLVIETFISDKSDFKSTPDEDRNNIDIDNLEVNHIDENIKNNNLNNLEWCTHKYNMNYGERNLKIVKHIKKPILQYNLDGKFIKEYESITQASKETKIPISSISANCYEQRNKTNGYVFKFKFLGDNK